MSDYYIQGFKFDVRASSSRKSLKKLRRESQQGKDITTRNVTEEEVSSPRFEEAQVDTSTSKDSTDVVVVAPRDKVLQACTVTSGLMAALGLIIRKVNPFERFGFVYSIICILLIWFLLAGVSCCFY